VEGAEKLFLEGGIQTLRKHQPIMILEWNVGPHTYSGKDMVEFIRAIGNYDFFSIRWKGLVPLRNPELMESGINVLCAIRNKHANRIERLVGS
jgi:hypothetical protein